MLSNRYNTCVFLLSYFFLGISTPASVFTTPQVESAPVNEETQGRSEDIVQDTVLNTQHSLGSGLQAETSLGEKQDEILCC